MAKYKVGDGVFFVRRYGHEFKVSYGHITATPVGVGKSDYYWVDEYKLHPKNIYLNYHGAHLVMEACNARIKEAYKNIGKHFFATLESPHYAD